jgi:hypothetical protein
MVSKRLRPYVRRRWLWPYGWFGAASVAIWLVASIVFLGLIPRLPTPLPKWAPVLANLPLNIAFVFFIAQLTRRSRERKRAIELDARACPKCGYALAAGDGPLRCAECGEAWTRRELEAFWQLSRWPPPEPTKWD